MKKILFIIVSLLAFNLSADPDVKAHAIKVDQFQIVMGGVSAAYNKAMQICAEKGYNYFKFLKFSYKDETGQTMQMKGICKDKDGEIIKENISDFDMPFVGKASCSFEIICFKDAIKDETASDVQKYMQLVQQYQKPPEKVEGSKVIEITSLDQLNKEIATSNLPVFVDCYSTSCGPCKTFSPIFDKYSIEKASYGKFLKVNVNKVQEISEIYQLRGVPALLIFEKNGTLQDTKIGLPDVTKYLDKISVK